VTCGDEMDVVSLIYAQIGKRVDALVVFGTAFIEPYNPILVKWRFLERLFEFEFAGHFALVHHTLFDERLADFGNVARVVDTVIMQLFNYTEFVFQVAVEFTAEFVLSKV